MNAAVATPLDVKLMNMTATVLFFVALVLVGMAATRWATRLSLFDIKGIVVRGDVTHNNAVTLRANVAPRLSGTFFSVDLPTVRSAFEAVPWVRHATVRREFPNRLQVVLQEHRAEAYWGSDDETRLINSYGEVFEANTGEIDQDALPRLNGPQGNSADVLATYRALAPKFEHMDMPVDALSLSVGGSWKALLESGASIELGRGSLAELSERVQRFLATLTQVASRYERQPSALESADLRHENGYAIRLRGVSTVAATVPKK